VCACFLLSDKDNVSLTRNHQMQQARRRRAGM